uniref:ethylbenzene dehydrogenase-related protein n=1 Tax=uncultured Eudoraea sp. TaxID=1035614 RepID=UPI0026331921
MKLKKTGLLFAAFAVVFFVHCTHDDTPLTTIIESDPGVGISSDTLLVAKFETAPVFDGVIDEIWKEARPLVNTATVSPAGDRMIPLNSINSGTDASLEPIDLFDPYTGEAYNFSLRGGHDGEFLYLLLEWEDDSDSQDRESWYFKPDTQTWHQHNKYANHKNDKYYEDKFAMMFPIADASGNYPEGFQGSTCTITCHANLTDPQPGQKTTRHYMQNLGELADLWHWKRDRNVLSQSVDDGYIYDAIDKDQSTAAAN